MSTHHKEGIDEAHAGHWASISSQCFYVRHIPYFVSTIDVVSRDKLVSPLTDAEISLEKADFSLKVVLV